MITTPKIEPRNAQPYAAIRMAVPIPFGEYLLPAWDEVQRWLLERGIAATGPSIIRYLTTDMSTKLDIEVGFAIDRLIPGDERITVEALPAGQYATLLYTGPYQGDGIYQATVALIDWANKNGISWQTSQINGVERWHGRTEFYLTDPDIEPDPEKYQTELAFLVK